MKPNGQRCRGGAKNGHRLCGPHQDRLEAGNGASSIAGPTMSVTTRKVSIEEIYSERQLEMRDHAYHYDGDFEFMVSMRDEARSNPNWIPTARQMRAIERCMKVTQAKRSRPKPVTEQELIDF